MGFFKKIGNFVKKATKQISFKNLVKIGTPLLGAIPLVGGQAQSIVSGLSEQHEAKKMEAQQQAEYDAAVQQQQASAANQQFAKQNPNFGEIMIGAAGGALQGAGNVLAPSQTVGQIGAKAVDSTLTEWLKKYWWKLALGVVGVALLIWGIMKMLRGGFRSNTLRRK